MSDHRRAELAKIHLAKKDLGLDDEAYRAMLHAVAGVESAAALDEAGRHAIIAHLRSRGWRPQGRRVEPATERAPLVGKVRAMLASATRPDAYADAMARRMFGVDRFEWLAPEELRKLVAALTYDAKRRARGTR